ncbi:imidazolonepropionase-like amidohydrolase [Christiangramia gaetbulicola]|uniref:Imidazolonepropionase-like amidohydrolase n=1 Tax=Christiangramia gaetbulicola TaxID=703340 RepID=A0A2T6AKJ4_9FLAO|nr:amidohydrolase family protein [Christiangramia gaetbulicola]PTX44339.1 imidazolonepropionase-like amidohydrolase [Christiangramia gaetbulicola]
MKKLITILAAIFISSNLMAQDTYIHAGKLVDTKNGKVLNEQTIIVSGDRIKSIEKGYIDPDSSENQVIDLKNKTLLPGLTDMHVHIENETNPSKYLQRFTNNPADDAFNSVGFAEETLMAGFTTVRDLGGTGVNIALRDAINKGKVAGPRIFTAGKSLATTGGHADPTNGMKRDMVGDPGPKDGVVNSVEDARKAVRQRYKNGADLIKITATGGVLSVAKSSSNPQFFEEEIEEIVKTANDYGFHVAAHAHGDEGMQRAVKAGVKTIEHGTLMSEETMDLMKEYNSYLVPTITAGKEVTEKAEIENYYPELVVPKAREIGPQIQNTFSKAYKRGVPIVFGTDAGVFKHGENAREFGYMVEAGMPAMEAIQVATIVPAKILKVENESGQLAKGFYADIIAVDEDPTKNIKTLEDVKFVMKEGVVYKNK